MSLDSFILLGKVIRPHGLKGLLKIQSYAESRASFLEGGNVYIRCSSGELLKHKVISISPLKNIFLMKLKGLNDVGSAEGYRGGEIFVKKEAISREEGEYFWYECLGLEVYLENGVYLGAVSQIIPTSGHDIYLVKNGARETFIPATYEVIKEIDQKGRKMIISPMEGLLELNEV